VVTDVSHAGHVEQLATELVVEVRELADREGDDLYALLRLAYALAELAPQLTVLVCRALRADQQPDGG
jgi:hypothetical protein